MQGNSVAAAALRRGTAGFTMVELMFAIGVFMVAIVAAYTSQVASMNLIQTSRETKTAVAELQTAMEEVLLESFDDVPATFPAGQSIPAYSDRTLSGERIRANYPGAAGADPLEVQLVLTWNDYRGRQRTMTLSTLMTR